MSTELDMLGGSMKRKFEKWLGWAGAVRSKYQDEFDVLEAKVQTVLEELEGRVSYKDLYMIATMLAAGAVGNLVRAEANRREQVKDVKPDKTSHVVEFYGCLRVTSYHKMHVNVVCVGSPSFYDVAVDAVDLAKVLGRSVWLEFNGRHLCFTKNQNPRKLYLTWYKQTFGETQEQGLEKK